MKEVVKWIAWTLAGTLATTMAVAAFFIYGPFGLAAAYARDASSIAAPGSRPLVTEADLVSLPEPVRRYLRVAGAVGRPRPASVDVQLSGRIRGGATEPWMAFSAQQRSDFDRRSRYFYLDAAMYGLPVQGYHRYSGSIATMDIRLLGLLSVQWASGPELTRAETVTFFNDMCMLAPGTLVDRTIAWTPIDDRTARASFTNAGHTVRADLVFNDRGELVDFVSDDRLQSTASGGMKPMRWSTPLGPYRQFGEVRVAGRGEARWHEPSGAHTYIEINIDHLVVAP